MKMKTRSFMLTVLVMAVVYAQEGKQILKGPKKLNKILLKPGSLSKKFLSRTGAKLASLRGRPRPPPTFTPVSKIRPPSPVRPLPPIPKCQGRCAYPQETCAKKARCKGPNCFFCAETRSLAIPGRAHQPRKGPTPEEFARILAFKTAQAVAAIDPTAIANEILKKNKPKPPQRPPMRRPTRRRPPFPPYGRGMPMGNSIGRMGMNPYSMGMNSFNMMPMGGPMGMGPMGMGGMGMGGGMGGMGLESLMTMNMLGMDVGL